jgi:hypothetical protein
MKQRPSSEDSTISANQEIPRPLWKPKVLFKKARHGTVMSQLNPIHTLSYVYKISLNVILLYSLVSQVFSSLQLFD